MSTSKPIISAIFYKNPVALDFELHVNHKLQSVDKVGYSFAKEARAVYLTTIEFSEACKEYPIVFTKSGDKFSAMAAVSIDGKVNCFVKGNDWNARYIPAFVRRYPFIPGVSSDGEKSKITLMVDDSFTGFSPDADGEFLFSDNKASDLLQQISDFVRNYHAESNRTNKFVQRLVDLDLLIEKRLQINYPDGSSQYSIAGGWLVDEVKLKSLDPEIIEKMHKSGDLFLIHMHISSLRNFSYLATL